MELTATQLATLKSEFINDPRNYGYKPFFPPALGGTGSVLDSNSVAELINRIRTGSNGGPGIIVKRNDVLPLEILSAIDTRDLKASPTTLESAWLESLTQLSGGAPLVLFNEDDTNTLVKNNIDRLVNNAQGSQTRVNAVGKRNGSRAEELGFPKGHQITDVNVEAALRS